MSFLMAMGPFFLFFHIAADHETVGSTPANHAAASLGYDDRVCGNRSTDHSAQRLSLW